MKSIELNIRNAQLELNIWSIPLLLILTNLLKNDTRVVTIFLRVPKAELKKRLENRIDKPSPAEIKLRLNRFDYEESRINIYDYVLKNNDLEKTVQIIMAIIQNELRLEENGN